uniref:DUF4460 domain-containing protein n=1 Tax=Meloidogyne incognita TaxID=6306 RepID=A0A914NGB6_MELIC
MCPNTLRFLRNFPNVCVTQHCLFSAKEAAIALRPFYFAVHPDRFAQEPDIQTRNERALQVFDYNLSVEFGNFKNLDFD